MAENEWDRIFADQIAVEFAAAAESSATSLVQDEHTASETDTEDQVSVAPSIYSLTSSLRDQSFRQVHGRSLNTYSDVYSLPADEEEASRLSQLKFFWLCFFYSNLLTNDTAVIQINSMICSIFWPEVIITMG